jgi:hypothetical protein
MHTPLKELLAMAACTLLTASASAHSARGVRGPSPLIAIENEAPPKLIVDPPLPEPLARGSVFTQYRTENLRVLPVFGKAPSTCRRALAISISRLTTCRGTLSTRAAKP